MIVLAALSCAAFLGACAREPAPLAGAALVARGEYLTRLAGCHDCHTPMTPQGPDMTQALQGATLVFTPTIEMPWAPIAPPLAGVPGHYTQEQLQSFLQTGVRPDGSRALPPMPPFAMHEEDARAVVAYIASLPPVE
ncbi:MAG TPA: c-type cytochrome [Terricaulis sp.]|nr:c-type cytochrome [Terricaulis sp.]